MNFTFRLEPHDSAFDVPNPPFEVKTEASWHKIPYVIGWGETFKGMNTPRVLVFQSETGPLWRTVGPVVLVPEYSPTVWITSEFAVDSSRDDDSLLRQSFKQATQNRLLARLFFLNVDGHLRKHDEIASFAVFLTQRGWGAWRTLRQFSNGRIFPHREVGFWWSPDEPSLFEATSAFKLWESLRPQLETPDSPLDFARRYAKMSPESQESCATLVWNWKHGDRSEMEQVLRWLVLSQTKWWQTPRHVRCDFRLNGRTHDRIILDGGPKLHRIPSFGRTMAKVWDWFSPSINTQGLEQHLELKRIFDTSSHMISIEVREPTMHEQLEAALRWREWENTTR